MIILLAKQKKRGKKCRMRKNSSLYNSNTTRIHEYKLNIKYHFRANKIYILSPSLDLDNNSNLHETKLHYLTCYQWLNSTFMPQQIHGRSHLMNDHFIIVQNRILHAL